MSRWGHGIRIYLHNTGSIWSRSPLKRDDLVPNAGTRSPQKRDDLVLNAGFRSPPEEGRSRHECRHQKPLKRDDLVPNAGTRSPLKRDDLVLNAGVDKQNPMTPFTNF